MPVGFNIGMVCETLTPFFSFSEGFAKGIFLLRNFPKKFFLFHKKFFPKEIFHSSDSALFRVKVHATFTEKLHILLVRSS